MADNSKTVNAMASAIKKSHPNMSHRQVMNKARQAVIRSERAKKK